MKKRLHETIIIGAGISGLACARKLHENKKNFLIISEDIGGAITTSKDGKVNYGAQVILKNFHHLKKFAKIVKKMRLRKFGFHEGNKTYTLSRWEKSHEKFFKEYRDKLAEVYSKMPWGG